jgi:hypothetical protein
MNAGPIMIQIAQVQYKVDPAQQMIGRNPILKPKGVEKCLLAFRLPPHHRPISLFDKESEPRQQAIQQHPPISDVPQ